MREAETQNEGEVRSAGPYLVRRYAEGNTPEPNAGVSRDHDSLGHALQVAQANEHALRLRLHRVRDPRGLELLRSLREHIGCLKERIAARNLDNQR